MQLQTGRVKKHRNCLAEKQMGDFMNPGRWGSFYFNQRDVQWKIKPSRIEANGYVIVKAIAMICSFIATCLA
ncbi:hypothetical protein ACT7DB_01070 [Bacillus cereus]